MSGDVVRPKRVTGTVLDMVRSLGLLIVIVGVTLLFVPGLLHPSKSQKVQPYDYRDYVTGFHQVTHQTAYTPRGLPSGWYANSANLTHHGSAATLYIGWVTPDNKYAALYESDTSPTMPPPAATDRTISFTRGGLRIVVSGSASTAEEQALIRSLAR